MKTKKFEKGLENVVLQNEEISTCLKSIDGCHIQNVLKHWESLMDGTINPLT
jgi:hypothetical protein